MEKIYRYKLKRYFKDECLMANLNTELRLCLSYKLVYMFFFISKLSQQKESLYATYFLAESMIYAKFPHIGYWSGLPGQHRYNFCDVVSPTAMLRILSVFFEEIPVHMYCMSRK